MTATPAQGSIPPPAASAAPDIRPSPDVRRVDPVALACDLGCLGFACWTLVCNAVVAAGGNARALALSALAAILVVGVIATITARRRPGAMRWLGRADTAVPEPSDGMSPRLRFAFLTLGLAIAALYKVRPDLRLLCGLALGYFALSYAALQRASRPPLPPFATSASLGRENLALLGTGIVHALLALCAHVPDPDDSLYVNMAVAVADFPQQPLLSFDSLHGVAGAGFKGVYRLQSLELGVGLLNYLTQIPALQIFHLLVPAVAALCTPFALARLLRELDPARALGAVLIVLLLLVFDGGGGPGSYHKFGFIRLFQGKAVFVTVLLPLLIAYGIRFGKRPSPGTFALLAAAQVAALGTTVTALWAAPAAALLGVATPLRLRTRSVGAVLVALLASGYVLGWGLFLKLQLPAAALPPDAAGAPSEPAVVGPAADLVLRAYNMVLGHGTHLAGALLVALIAWPLCRTPLARRFAVVFPFGFFALLGNPWLFGVVSGLTTTSIYWRVVWLLPVPLLTALAVSAPLGGGRYFSRRAGLAAFAVVGALVVGSLSLRRPTLARAGLSTPGLKVDRRAYRVARALVRSVPPKHNVLAPPRISLVVPLLNGYSYPLATKPRFIPVSGPERKLRVQLGRVIEQARVDVDASWFVARLNEFHVDGVALPNGRPRRKLAPILATAGFHPAATVEGHVIWTRTSPSL